MARPARTAAGRHRLGGHGGFRKKADEEEVDPDVVAMTSEPAWKAEVEAKQKEAIRQGQLSASRAVSREASSRRFVVLAEGGGDPRAGGSAVDTSTAHDRPATFCWEARRAQPSNTSQAFFNSFRASRVSATSSQPAVQKLGRELSLSDSYEGAVYSDNTAYRSRKLGSASRCPGGLFGRPPALHTAPSSRQGATAAPPRPSSAPPPRPLQEELSLAASPRWGFLQEDGDAGSQEDAALAEEDVDVEVPAGNGLVMWSEEDLKNFAAKRGVPFDGERAKVQATVTDVLRQDLTNRIAKAHTKPLGLSHTPLIPKFAFKTDKDVTASYGQAREPRHLPSAAIAVLSTLRQAMDQSRAVFDQRFHDLREAFTAMDGDGSGSLSPEELEEGFRQLGVEVGSEAMGVLFDLLDADHNGTLSYDELLNAMRSDQGQTHRSASSGDGATLQLREIAVGGFKATRGPGGGVCTATLIMGDRHAPGGILGGASLVWTFSRNDQYRNRARISLPLSNVIGLDVTGATLTVELGRPPSVAVGHAFPEQYGGQQDEKRMQWDPPSTTPAQDQVTKGEVHKSRFHTLRATSARELNEWKEALTSASFGHQQMLSAGLSWASGGGLSRSATDSSEEERAARMASSRATDDGSFNSIHRVEFDWMHGSSNAAKAHSMQGASMLRPRSASPAGPSQSTIHEASTSLRSNSSVLWRDRQREHHRLTRSSQSLGNSGWGDGEANGRHKHSGRVADTQRPHVTGDTPAQWVVASSKQSLLGHRPRVGSDHEDGYGYGGAVARHPAGEADGIVAVKSPLPRRTPKSDARTRARLAARQSRATGTSRPTSAPSLYAETATLSDSTLRRLRVNDSSSTSSYTPAELVLAC